LTDIVGVAKEVRENNCRIIIKPKDSKGLAKAIIKILNNPKLAKKWGGE
jgi:glycosyltransferase involved in cell wall biosynthesis